MLFTRMLLIAAALIPVHHAMAADLEYDPGIADASDEGDRAIGRFAVPEGWDVELIAAEPMLANPVAFYIGNNGHIYVAETFRHHQGVSDMRGHTEWLLDDLAARTVEDRLIAMKKNLGNEIADYTAHHDRVRLLVDEDGDGKTDRATIFSDGYRDALAGIGAGLLVDEGNVYFTCIPELWRLRDEDGNGEAEVREVMSSGYGVHINFLGHDLHGLRKGPDGRLYFSIGDRGIHVTNQEGDVLDDPDTGVVLRCFPDGSGLEIFHRGLRNPQELAFDNYGNLFTGDNNSDAGDKARLVWLVNGGDSGWRIGWQWISKPVARGPWNSELMWEPHHEGQPAHHLPPIVNIGAGPSGFTHYPGTGLGDEYDGHFFMCDFRGDATMSLIHAFAVEPKGASFEMVNRHDFANHMLCTDVDFGPGAGIYFSDWVQGWDQPKKGRIYRIYNEALEKEPIIVETKVLLNEGMGTRDADELFGLLGHRDQRVRLEAQWELARRGEVAVFTKAAAGGNDLLVRLHGMWGLWQLALAGDVDATPFIEMMSDADPEVRAQATMILGDLRADEATTKFVAALNDRSDRVKFFAASALGRVERAKGDDTLAAIVDLLRNNNNADPYLRYAGVQALAQQAAPATLISFEADASAAVRLGAVLALRRLGHEGVGDYLGDADAFVQVEAARAINDHPIPAAYEALASLLSDDTLRSSTNASLVRRVLNANLRTGNSDGAQQLAHFVANPGGDLALRAEALGHLGQWTEPYPLDAVDGSWRPAAGGEAEDVKAAITPIMAILLGDEDENIRIASAELAGQYDVKSAGTMLLALVRDDKNDSVRVAALRALAAMRAPELAEATVIARDSRAGDLRIEGIVQLGRLDPETAVATLAETLKSGGRDEQRAATLALAEVDHEGAEALLVERLAALAKQELPAHAQVELLEAVKARGGLALTRALADYDKATKAAGGIAPYLPALEGGSSSLGRRVFFDNTAASCQRCHVIKGKGGGGGVGPDLSDVGARLTSEQILASIVNPNEAIAIGYENVTLELEDGTELRGRVLEETDTMLKLEVHEEVADIFADVDEAIPHSDVDVIADGSGAPIEYPTREIAKKDIASRKQNISAMPDGLADTVSLRDLRDLVAYLAARK